MASPLRAWWDSVTKPEQRGDLGTQLSLQDYVDFFNFGGTDYPFFVGSPTAVSEEVGTDFRGFAQGMMRANPVVFAVMEMRRRLFSDGRFQWRRIRNGRPGDYFGSPELRPLEQPWPGGTTTDLLSRMIQDADLAGNAYVVRLAGGQLRRLRPDWVTIVLGSNRDAEAPGTMPDVTIAGYLFHPGGRGVGDPIPFIAQDVAHFAPTPDPVANFRGMSWLTPVIREMQSDNMATTHKLRFFESGASKRTVVTMDPGIDQETLDNWVEKFRNHYSGAESAYKMMFLAGGTGVDTIGTDMQEVDFKKLSAVSENRICMAGGVPPILVGASEGLAAATYSNYGMARRAFSDGTMRHLWRLAAGALETVVELPSAGTSANGGPGTPVQLWVDDRDISFLQEDQKDAAEIASVEAQAMDTLIKAGYEAETVTEAVISGDYSVLEHTGLVSVQMQDLAAPEDSQPEDQAEGETTGGTAQMNGKPEVIPSG